MFFDYSENLPILGLSSPHEVSEWNEDIRDEALQLVFIFTFNHLQDYNCIVVFHSWSTKAKSDITGLCQTYEMVKECMDMNHMHLTSTLNNTKTINSIHFLKLLQLLYDALYFMLF